MKVLALDLGKTFIGLTAEGVQTPRYCDLRGYEYPHLPFVRYSPDLADEWAAEWLRRMGSDVEFMEGVTVVAWEAPGMHPTRQRARVNPDSIQGLQRMAKRCVEFAVARGLEWCEVDVQQMTAQTTFRKLTKANAETCITMAGALLAEFPFGQRREEGGRAWFGPCGGLGIAEHVWDAARIARYVLTSPCLAGVQGGA